LNTSMNPTGTTVTFGQYFLYLFKPGKMIGMLLMALLCIAAAILLIVLACRGMSRQYTEDTRHAFMEDEVASLTERFYELIFSTTFILLFVAIYFAIDYFGMGTTNRVVWNKYNGIILLLFILGSVILNSLVDNRLIPLNHIRPGERGAMRLLGMIYMLIIFAYIKFFYQDSNYDNIIMYFITLVIGRFVYFDASLESFQEAMQGVRNNLPLLALGLMCSAIMGAFGFNTHYLLEQYGVVFNLFYAHLFLLVIIAIVHRSKVLNKIVDRSSQAKAPEDSRLGPAAGTAYPGQETMWINAKEINERERELRYQKARDAEQNRQKKRRMRLDEAVNRALAKQKREQAAQEKAAQEERFDPWKEKPETKAQLFEQKPPKRKTTNRRTRHR
jgi:hypothetical protein